MTSSTPGEQPRVAQGRCGLGLVAAFASPEHADCQAGERGSSGPAVDPVAASAVRVSAVCAAHLLVLWLGARGARYNKPTVRVLAQTALNGLVGTGWA